MLGVSDSSGNSSGAAAAANYEGDAGVDGSIPVVGDSASAAAAAAADGLGGGGGEEEENLRGEEGDRNLTGNRWPRQETLALLKIRSDMEVAFRDSTLKGPLWGEVSRKLAELGYHRSAKKCKEKFENVYKYYKRTKEGRAARADGKAYRFFDQLEALDHHHPSLFPHLSPPKPLQSQFLAAPSSMPTTTATPLTVVAPPPLPPPPPIVSTPTTTPTAAATTNTTIHPISTSSPVSSSSSEEESGGSRSRKRKRKKLTAFFEKLMNEVMEKQEMLQKKFLETVEKRDRERVAREEAWKVQEMARMNREHELMLQERSIAAARDAAVIAFLQKISEQASPMQSTELQLQLHENQNQQNPKSNPLHQPPHPAQPLNQAQPLSEKMMMVEIPRPTAGNAAAAAAAADSLVATTSSLSSRWPKPEVQALIRLRTSLDLKYQENGPKGPLWEEISASMRKLGYNRSAKRCKEKWENINKYFKKVKESNKKRPEDAKTCPYYHQLDALYKGRSQIQQQQQKMDSNSSSSNAALVVSTYGVKPENMVMPLRQEPPRPQSDVESENNMEMEMEQNQEQDEDGDDEVEDEGGDYEIVANNSSSLAIVE